MSVQSAVKDGLPPRIERARAECATGARIAEWKANRYRQLSRAQTDDTTYEACRSMSRFYEAMREFFMEQQRAIDALLGPGFGPDAVQAAPDVPADASALPPAAAGSP